MSGTSSSHGTLQYKHHGWLCCSQSKRSAELSFLLSLFHFPLNCNHSSPASAPLTHSTSPTVSFHKAPSFLIFGPVAFDFGVLTQNMSCGFVWDRFCFTSELRSSAVARADSRADRRVTAHQIAPKEGGIKPSQGETREGSAAGMVLPAHPYGRCSAEELARESLFLYQASSTTTTCPHSP